MRLVFAAVFSVLVMTQIPSDLRAGNLVVNGDFEDPVISRFNSDSFTSIPGWTASEGEIEIQVGDRTFVGQALAPGQQFVELDGSRNGAMYQDVPTVRGTDYQLEFFYSPRNRFNCCGFSEGPYPAITNVIEVYWEGTIVDSLSAQSILFANEWTFQAYDLIADSPTGQSRLEFVAAGRSDSIGGLIDKVTLVPEPSSSFLGLAAAITMIGIARRRSGPSQP